MNAINFFKLDMRLLRDTLKYYIAIPLIFIFIIMRTSPVTGLGYLFFVMVIVATLPFSVEGNERCSKLYYMLPSKISNMVTGRFLYLIGINLLIWLMAGGVMTYLYEMNRISALEIGVLCFSGIIATIIGFCQYPLYYRFGMEKGNILSNLIYMAPAFLVFMLPSILGDNKIITQELLDKALSLLMSNIAILPLFGFAVVGIVGIASYRLSCLICRRKEL